MKTKDRDIASYVAIVDSFIDQAALDKTQADLIKKELKTYITVRFQKNKWVHPEITKFCTDWYREFYRMVDGRDPYRRLKDQSNEIAQDILSSLRIVSFNEKIAASIIGNKIDYGACLVAHVDLEAMRKDFMDLNRFTLDVDDTAVLKEKLSHAKKVLYLVDNCGEIVFDTLLLDSIMQQVGKENLYIMAKGSPMLNDATVEYLWQLGFQRFGTIVSTGSNCFGLHSEDVSDECKQLLSDADLIIAKGQAYFEFFTEYNFANVMNILIVKYPVVNETLGIIPSGAKMVISSERYAVYGKDYFAEEKEHA